jgi:hypothetical protein
VFVLVIRARDRLVRVLIAGTVGSSRFNAYEYRSTFQWFDPSSSLRTGQAHHEQNLNVSGENTGET